MFKTGCIWLNADFQVGVSLFDMWPFEMKQCLIVVSCLGLHMSEDVSFGSSSEA